MLTPAAEFEYSPRVRELFANLHHAGSLSVASAQESGSRAASTVKVVGASVGSREQGACVQLFIEMRDGYVQTATYKAYGCPHFLAACESLARWLEGRACSELSQWNWREVEAELDVPPAKRSRLLLLSDALSALSQALDGLS